MNTLIKELCRHGTISFDIRKKGYSVTFEPYTSNSLSDNLQSTVLIIRSSPIEATTALNQYITGKKHWSEYPEDYWVSDLSLQGNF